MINAVVASMSFFIPVPPLIRFIYISLAPLYTVFTGTAMPSIMKGGFL
jgi:hypothetical protein